MEKARVWSEPPPMETGAPLPATRIIGDRLLVAYVCNNLEFPGWNSGAQADHPGFSVYSAVLEFRGVSSFSLGPPNDERLFEHPLYGAGLEFYQFHEVESVAGQRPSRWVVTFHDETLEVVADSAKVLHARIDGEDTHGILDALA